MDVCKQDTGTPSQFSTKKILWENASFKRQSKNPISDNLGYFLVATKLCYFLVLDATASGLHTAQSDKTFWTYLS